MQKVAIIGAGPHGNNVAWKLAEKGFEVDVYEEHEKIGLPIACTGLLSDTIDEILKVPKEAINNKITRVEIHGKNASTRLLIRPNLIVDRRIYDESYRKKAEEAGARFHLGHRFEGIRNDRIILKTNKGTKTAKTDILIGADGPNSATAKSAGLWKNRSHLIGIQARVRGKYENKIMFYPMIETYAWIVPESKTTARIGIAARNNARATFEQFMGKARMKRIIDYQAGPIPLHHPRIPTQTKRAGMKIYLLGDAAGQIKNTTGGGLIPGLMAGNILAESIAEGKDYEKEWKKKIGKELWLHYVMRKTLDNFSGKEYDELIEIFNKPRVNTILKEESRDRPSKIIPKLAMRAPELIKFTQKIRI
jgi:geranylgeranyl reductase family protein